ncbi:serine hydrolase domain-containing protein [Raineyella sp. LH-20]|uniref:serine hydrolase domain-containing protein n=1 Tax=Raineyella sp. LH-20 TaxID=3081204 RepID=UPI002954285B|nr:serine hydrolase domain-containing protein [Raineyella sp. LH-20]WOP18660.1 serine hydrolase domain-containing protein [Raineyella sp. LH-20]
MRTPSARATAVMPAETAAALDAAAAEGLTAAATSGAVVAVRSPQGTWTKAYGVADPTTKAPMTTDVHQRIGSVTKTFTGTLVLQLAQQGKLTLDDPISTYVPGVPNGKDVTLRMLLTMTSGIASYTLDQAFTDKLFADPQRTWTPDELLAVGLALPPQFAPGAKFDYSNTNTILLGKVIEKVTGKPYADVLTEQVLLPLGLSTTSMPSASDSLPAPHASGFTLQGTPDGSTTPINTTDWNPTWAWTAGQMVSSVDDLLVYGRALGTGQGLLDTTAQVDRLSSFPGTAGYGLAVGCIDGWVGHTGELPGYNTTLFYDTTNDTTVVVLANSDIPSGGCTASKTLPDTPKGLPCMDPAVRIFTAVSAATGHAFTPNPKS